MAKYYKKAATSVVFLYAYVDSDDYPEIFDKDGEIIDEEAFKYLDDELKFYEGDKYREFYNSEIEEVTKSDYVRWYEDHEGEESK
tara:strand:+ start:487 stop:741 length:255 start_codon:yes stop_codon:yes gene_type:complete